MAYLGVKGDFLKHSHDAIPNFTENDFMGMSVEAKRQFSYTYSVDKSVVK